jgi:hypothetical protein
MAATLIFAKAERDSIERDRQAERVVYRDRVREVPPDTVLVGLPPACDECVARSRAQDLALAAADSLLATQDTVIARQDTTLAAITRDLSRADYSLVAAREAIAKAARSDRRTILGVPLPEVFAGYGLSLSERQLGPVVALGWKVAF